MTFIKIPKPKKYPKTSKNQNLKKIRMPQMKNKKKTYYVFFISKY